MSGDVQPRKRKDKRKKKNEELDSLNLTFDTTSFHKLKTQLDKKKNNYEKHSEKILLQNDKNSGGNNYVKILLFCLLGLLVVIVGMICLLSQSSTNEQPSKTENSRFADYFAGWTDNAVDNSDYHSISNHNEQSEPIEKKEINNNNKNYNYTNYDNNIEKDFIKENNNQNNDPNLLYSQFSSEEEKESVKHNTDEGNNAEKTYNQLNLPQNNKEMIQEDKNIYYESGSNKDEEKKNISDKDYDYFYYDNEYDSESKIFLRQLKKFKFQTDNKPILNGDEDEDENDDNDNDYEGSDNNDKENDDENYDASQTEEDDVENDYDHEKDKENEENKRSTKNYFESKDREKQYVDKHKKLQKLFNFKKLEKNTKKQKEFYNDLDYNEIDKGNKYKIKMLIKKKNYNIDNKYKKKYFINPISTDLKSDLEQKTERKTTEKIKEDPKEKIEEAAETEKRVIVKLGVGIALIIVAHLVFVQKWKTKSNVTSEETTLNGDNENKNSGFEYEPVIWRRQTLVPNSVSLNNENNEIEVGLEEEIEKYSERKEDSYPDNEEVESQDEEDEENENKTDDFVRDYEIINSHNNEKENKLLDIKSKEKRLNEKKKNVSEFFDDGENEDNYEYDEHYSEEEDEDYSDENYEENQREGINSVDTKNKRVQEGGAQFIENELKDVSNDIVKDDSQQDEIESEETWPEENFEENKVGNEEELSFSQEFKLADEQFQNNPKAALHIYDEILAKKPTLLKALINRPRALDRISELERSNAYLKQATNAYKSLLLQDGHRIDDVTFAELANRCILRMRFGGYLRAAIDVHKALVARFPLDPKHRNTFAVTYLMLNQIESARKLLNETLTLWPENGFALVHYGFIVKTADKNMEEGARLLMKGIKSEEEGVMDGMFFFHLGDALNRLGRSKEAVAWYDLGVKKGLFLSRYQRSLYNVNRLKGQPWWTKEETTYQDFFKKLEFNWREIRKEGLNLLNAKGMDLFKEESENLKDIGDWRQLDLFFRGKMQANCQKAPVTCSLVSSFKPAAKCTRGQIKFSVMLPNTHVWPHCGPTNCRLRSHLGLVIPPNTYLRVAEETRSWEEGKFIVFDDSFEHEVWHNGTGLRLVLIVDVWHPELTEHEKLSLSPI